MRREVDEAMRTTTETLSQVTNLLAIVSAPPLDTATIRHVEVLLLQPQVADGRRDHLDRRRHEAHLHVRRAGRPRAGGVGRRVPQRAPRGRRASARACCSSACSTRSLGATEQRLPGAARAGLHRARRDRRGRALRRRRRAPARPSTACRTSRRSTSSSTCSSGASRCSASCAPRSASATSSCGSARENELPALRVAGARGRRLRPADAQARHRLGHRPGADGLRAARSRPCARPRPAVALHRRRLRRRLDWHRWPAPPRDPYEVLGVAARRRRDADQEGVPQARARAAPRRQRATIPTPRRSSRRPRRPTRSSPTPSAARPTTATATRACARGGHAPELRRVRLDQRPLRGVLRRRSGAASAAAPSGPVQGGDVAVGGRDRPRRRRPHGATVEVSFEAVDVCEHCHGNGAEPGTPIDDVRALRRDGPAAGGRAARRSARWCARRRATSAAATGACPRAVHAVRRARPRGAAAHAARRRPGGHRRRPAHPPRRAAATPASAAARRAISTCRCACARTSASCATATTSYGRSTCPRRSPRSAPTLEVPDARRRRGRSRSRRAPSRARSSRCKRQGMPRAAAPGRRGDLRVVVNVVDPAPALARAARAAASSSPRRWRTENLARSGESLCGKLQRAWLQRMIRLALRVRRDDAELVARRAARAGARRASRSATGRRRRRVRGLRRARRAARRCRTCAPRPAARSSRSCTEEIADDWHERWRAFHRPVASSARPLRRAARPPAVGVAAPATRPRSTS